MKRLLFALALAALLLGTAFGEGTDSGFKTSLDYDEVLSNPDVHRNERYMLSGTVTRAQKARINVANWSNPWQILLRLADIPQYTVWVVGDCPAGYDSINAEDHVRFTGAYQGPAEIAVSSGGTTFIPFFMAGSLFILEE